MNTDFTFSLKSIRFDEHYVPSDSTRLTTNFANLARGESRQQNLRRAMKMIDNRFNDLAHWDNPTGDRYAVELEIISVELDIGVQTDAAFPFFEILKTHIVDKTLNRRIDGIVGNNFSSYVRDYDFSVVLPEHNADRAEFSVPDDFGVLHGTFFKHFINSNVYQERFSKLPVICLSVSTSKTYRRTVNHHPILGVEYQQNELSLTDQYFAKMGMQVRFFMPPKSVAPLAFYFFGDLLSDYTDLELIGTISTMEAFQRIYRPEIYNANSVAGQVYHPSLNRDDCSLTQIVYDREERSQLALKQGKFTQEHFIKPHQRILEQWAAEAAHWSDHYLLCKESSMFETSIVGSLPKPAWLAETNKLWPKWAAEGDALLQAKADATLLWIKAQEDAGLDIVCDGEQSRQHFVHGFLEQVEGIDFDNKVKMGIRDNRYDAMVPQVVSKLRMKGRVHAFEAQLARAHTNKKLKFTLPGPMTIVDTVADRFYGDKVKLAFAFAELLNQEALALQADGVDIIQFDEPAFNVYMKDAADWGVKALERAAQGLTCKTAVHICYGYGIQANTDWKSTLGEEWRQYELVFPELAKSRIDQVSLECMHSHVPLELLKLLEGKDVLVGVIDVASDVVETPAEVADAIGQALQFVPKERLFPCTNCGMAPMPREVAERKMQALVKGTKLAKERLASR